MMPSPRSALRDRVLAAASSTPSRTRREGRRIARLALAASLVVALVVFELSGGVGHSSGRPAILTWALAAGWALAAAALSWITFGRGHSTLARRPVVLAAVAVAAPALCFAWMHAFSGAYAEPFARVGYRCFALTVLVSVIPLGAFLALRRGIEPRVPSALGAAAGASIGAWAGVIVDLWCPLTNTAHSLFGHVLPIVLLGVIGGLVGRKTLGVRTLTTR
jgi:hypothetical protein